jgi:hypothetical protein
MLKALTKVKERVPFELASLPGITPEEQRQAKSKAA